MVTKRTHKGCGGEVHNRKCSKCDKVWTRTQSFLGQGIKEVEEKFDPKEYRRRIREGRDIG